MDTKNPTLFKTSPTYRLTARRYYARNKQDYKNYFKTYYVTHKQYYANYIK